MKSKIEEKFKDSRKSKYKTTERMKNKSKKKK